MNLDNEFILKIKKDYYETCYLMKQCLYELNALHRILFGDDITSYNEMARKIRGLFATDGELEVEGND